MKIVKCESINTKNLRLSRKVERLAEENCITLPVNFIGKKLLQINNIDDESDKNRIQLVFNLHQLYRRLQPRCSRWGGGNLLIWVAYRIVRFQLIYANLQSRYRSTELSLVFRRSYKYKQRNKKIHTIYAVCGWLVDSNSYNWFWNLFLIFRISAENKNWFFCMWCCFRGTFLLIKKKFWVWRFALCVCAYACIYIKFILVVRCEYFCLNVCVNFVMSAIWKSRKLSNFSQSYLEKTKD